MNTGTPIIPPQTGEVTDVASFPVVQKMLPATLMVSNIGAGESVAILVSLDGGDTFEPVFQDGVALVMDNTSNSISIQAPVLLGVTKTATALAVGVSILTTNAFSTGINTPINKYAAGGKNPDMAFVPRDNFYWTSAAQTTFPAFTGGTFERNSTATDNDGTGDIITASIDQARVNSHLFDGTSYARVGMTAEGSTIQILDDPVVTAANSINSNVTFTDLSDNALGAFPGLKIAGTGGTGNLGSTGNEVVVSGSTYTTKVFIKAGTSGKVRLNLRDISGAVDSFIGGTVGALSVQSQLAGVLTLIEEIEVPDGVWIYARFVPNFSGNLKLGVGPFSSVSGEDVIWYFRQFELASVSSSSILVGNASRGADDLRIPATVMAKAMADKAGSVNLGTNGTFAGNITGWAAESGATIAYVAGDRMSVTNAVGDAFAYSNQAVPTILGEKYLFESDVFSVSDGREVGVSSTQFGARDLASSGSNADTGKFSQVFTGTGNDVWIRLIVNGDGENAVFNSATIREVTMPAAITIVVKMRSSYADNSEFTELRSIRYAVDNDNFAEMRLNTSGANTGNVQMRSEIATVNSQIFSGNVYTPGLSIPMAWAFTFGTVLEGAVDGIATSSGTASAMVDLTTADLIIGDIGTFPGIAEVLIFFADIGDDGRIEATS